MTRVRYIKNPEEPSEMIFQRVNEDETLQRLGYTKNNCSVFIAANDQYKPSIISFQEMKIITSIILKEVLR